MGKFATVAECLLVIGLLAGSASAVISAQWVLVDPGSDPYPAGGYVTWDLMVTTGTNVAAAQIHLVPDVPGSIYQDPAGGNIQTTSDFLRGFSPTVDYDTYVTMPPDLDDPDRVSTQTIVDIAGALAIPTPPVPYPVGAVGGDPLGPLPPPFDVDQWSIGWTVSSGEYFSGPGTHRIMRLTILEGTTGDMWFFVKGTDDEAAGTGLIHMGGNIPEPASLLLLLAGGVAMMSRRK